MKLFLDLFAEVKLGDGVAAEFPLDIALKGERSKPIVIPACGRPAAIMPEGDYILVPTYQVGGHSREEVDAKAARDASWAIFAAGLSHRKVFNDPDAAPGVITINFLRWLTGGLRRVQGGVNRPQPCTDLILVGAGLIDTPAYFYLQENNIRLHAMSDDLAREAMGAFRQCEGAINPFDTTLVVALDRGRDDFVRPVRGEMVEIEGDRFDPRKVYLMEHGLAVLAAHSVVLGSF